MNLRFCSAKYEIMDVGKHNKLDIGLQLTIDLWGKKHEKDEDGKQKFS